MVEPLTDRELMILKLMSEGLSNGEIADRLSLSVATVKWYNTRIFKKLGVKNRRQAVQHYRHQLASKGVFNLPAQTTPFIGREAEKTALIDQLRQPWCRLVTVLGPGGMGKTRLALAAAETMRLEFPGGVCFIPVDSLNTPDDLAREIAKVMDYTIAQPEDIQQQIINHLRLHAILLVFDNFEESLGCVPFINDLLSEAGHVKILVTSRQSLSLKAETIFSLTGMAFPPDDLLDTVQQYDALRLFEDTARRVKRGWELTPENSKDIVHICRLTEGMPLGIIMAASWLNVLTTERIIMEIQQGIGFLESSLSDIPPRQRSVRAVFDSTWKYLSPAEQQTFMELAIFRGGFTLAAAETVTRTTLLTLQSLVKKALVQPVHEGRFDIHNLLWQYGEDRLKNHAIFASIEAAHARFFTSRVHTALEHVLAGNHKEALDIIQLDYDNIQHAWNWAVQHRDYTLLQDLIEGLYVFGFTRFHSEKLFRHGLDSLGPELDIVRAHLVVRSWDIIENPQQELERVLPVLQAYGEDPLTAAALQALAWLCYDLDQNPLAAMGYHRQTLDIFRRLGNKVTELNVLCNLGLCSARLGDLDAAYAYYDQGEKLGQHDTLDYTFLVALTAELALLSGDYGTAAKHYEQALERTRHLKVPWGELWNLGCLGLLKLLDGDRDGARQLAAEAELENGRRHSDQIPARVLLGMIANLDANYQNGWDYCDMTAARENMYGFSPQYLGQIGQAIAACGLGDFASARQRIQIVWDKVDYSPSLRVMCLPVIAWLYADCNQLIEAVEILSLAANHRLSTPARWNKWPLVTKLRAVLKSDLPDPTFYATWEQGKSLSLHDVKLP